jgi:lipid-binding SYLF domain-containing protein
MILVFNDQAALDKFREGDRKWEVGADLSVTVAKIGATGKLDTTKMQAAVVALVFGEKGLMGDLSLEGSNFKKLTIEEK